MDSSPSLLFLVPRGDDLLDFGGPFDLSSATVAEFAVEKDLNLAIVAEEAFLLLQFLGYRQTVGHRFKLNPMDVICCFTTS